MTLFNLAEFLNSPNHLNKPQIKLSSYTVAITFDKPCTLTRICLHNTEKEIWLDLIVVSSHN